VVASGGGSKKKLVMGVREGGDGEAVQGDPSDSSSQEKMSRVHVAQQDLHFLINSDQLPGFMTSGTGNQVRILYIRYGT
jgi:hypothetical protein